MPTFTDRNNSDENASYLREEEDETPHEINENPRTPGRIDRVNSGDLRDEATGEKIPSKGTGSNVSSASQGAYDIDDKVNGELDAKEKNQRKEGNTAIDLQDNQK